MSSSTNEKSPAPRAFTWSELEALLVRMEAHQRDKVLALARRLRPGLTAEDIQNPHDFPELGDLDWHYEDGVLTGIQTVVTAMRALVTESTKGED